MGKNKQLMNWSIDWLQLTTENIINYSFKHTPNFICIFAS